PPEKSGGTPRKGSATAVSSTSCPHLNLSAVSPGGGPVVKHKPRKAEGVLAKFKSLRVASNRPLPTEFATGQYAVRRVRPGLWESLKSLNKEDVKTLRDLIKTKVTNNGIIDDKTMLMERLIRLVAKMPNDSKVREELTNGLITELWDTLDHPPLLDLSRQTRYRIPDGSYNNPRMPMLGAAGQPYCRSVRPGKLTLGAMPDPGLIFDTVMAREEFRQHPNNVSSVLWYWATIITHDLFWTDPMDPTRSKTSSYLDLSPLYGSNQAMLDSIRTFKDGKLKADSFADRRLLGMPPGVCVILVMFNRFHNHVAETLAAINENNRFAKPDPAVLSGAKLAEAWKQYDEELFQVARLVTSGLYINITLVDYVRNIINLNRVDTNWTLDPRQEMGKDVGTREGAERGTGNTVSAEFNLCYRWHSCISARDERWINDFYGNLFANEAATSSPRHMMCAIGKFEAAIPADPLDRTFGGFARGPDGRFSDDDLVDCLATAIEEPAGSFGARNVPKAMRPIEMLGVLRGRKWELAGLNEFRKHFGLKPYDTFEDINSDPEVAGALKNLYQHPDNVELYTGLVAEESKDPMVPAVGIAPTYTISRVILSDAVCLIRGDRFYTTDYHPKGLTSWGYKEVDYDLNVNHGCVFYKLFLRAFPQHFKQNSVYAHYPMVVPSENAKILASLNREQLFDFARPAFIPPRVQVDTYGGAQAVLENPDMFRVTWGEGLSFLMGTGGSRFMLAGDSPFHASQRVCMGRLLYRDGWLADIKAFYAQTAAALLDAKSFVLHTNTGPHRFVDVVRDFGNAVHTRFAARMFALPIKTERNPRGIFAEQELYRILAAIFTTIFFDLDPAKSFPLRQYTKEVSDKLAGIIAMNVKLAKFGIAPLYAEALKKDEPLAAYGKNMYKALAAQGFSPDDVVNSHILPTAGAMVPNQAQVFAQAVDFYLRPENAAHVTELHSLATAPSSPETDELLLGYAMEGARLAGTFGAYREATADTVISEDDGRQIPVNAGARVFVSFVQAAHDPRRFPDPEKVDPRRPREAYLHYGKGPHACLGREASEAAITELFRALWSKKNVRRMPGLQGELKKVERGKGFFVYMDENWSQMTPFPQTMKIMWDE
ncbi:hypothetical protein TD95_000745, partial [Thielaviopsis punctulata]